MDKEKKEEKLYESDITREQFAVILPILERCRHKTKRRTIDLYRVFCAVLYVLRTGCQWRMIPNDYPHWRTCYYYYQIWSEQPDPSEDSAWQTILKKNDFRLSQNFRTK